jgi:repressor LexA
MIKLTARQEQILNLIRDAIVNTGFPPTRAEIARELGFKSVNAAEEHLQALARKGAIDIAPGTSRGIRLREIASDYLKISSDSDSLGERSIKALAQQTIPYQNLRQISLPLVGRVAAGSPILAQEHIEKIFAVDRSLFSAIPDFLLKVRGMSMRDAGILDGDLLAVKKADQAHNGQIIVARLGDEVTVKRYRKTGSLIELLPENPEFAPIQVDVKRDEFALEGLAVGLMRAWG